VAALAFAPGCGESAAPPARHNVLLVTLDTTRADRLGCYGGSAATPNVDRLAEEGALFARAVSTAGLTPMSHASILTGLNNYRHGLRVFYSKDASFTLGPSNVTLPEILGEHGWSTAAFVSAYPVSEFYGVDQGFETFDTGLQADLDLSRQQQHEELWNETGRSDTQRRGDFTVDAALAWLERQRDRPWCLWVHLFDAHDFSMVPPAEWSARAGVTYDRSVTLNDLAWRERMYDLELSFMDEQLGRLFEAIRAQGAWDETAIAITADHGQGLTDGLKNHGWLKHRLLYEWGLHVPLILKLPGLDGDRRVEPLVRTIDILPTLLEALDLAGPPMEGESLLALMRGGPDDGRIAYADALNLLDAHAPQKMRPEYADNLFCATDARWKLIWHQTKPGNVELFDLASDPEELRNLAGEHPAEVERLKAFLDQRRAMQVQAPRAGAPAPDKQALEELGYVGDEDEDAEETEAEPDPGSEDGQHER
jgi:arylsulfatase A-like enzyme